MSFIAQVLGFIGRFAIEAISALGYFGVFFLMILESMVFPIPSELVMPFAGFLAATGTFDFWLVCLFSTAGSIAGSLISYYIGLYGGNRFIRKYGHLFLLDKDDLESTEKWFKKSGEATIFIARLIPVVRHIISIPAGMGRMNIKRFLLYTFFGALIWNSFLAYLGYVLGQNWDSVKNYTEPISICVVILLILGFGYFVYKHIVKKGRKKKK